MTVGELIEALLMQDPSTAVELSYDSDCCRGPAKAIRIDGERVLIVTD